MPSPFPGMDPYIEGHKWEDFHTDFMIGIRSELVPAVRPRYAVFVQERVYVEHFPEPTRGVIKPDLTVVDFPAQPRRTNGAGTAVLSPPMEIPLPTPERMREVFLEVHALESHEVVTVIEILSPSNKRSGSDGRREYLRKREAVIDSPSHLVELDLLRGGERMPMGEPLPAADFYAILSRRERRPIADVWWWTLRDPLPPLPIPLMGEEHVPLDLQAVFSSVYDRAGYDYSLDYSHGTTPPLSGDERAWAESLVAL